MSYRYYEENKVSIKERIISGVICTECSDNASQKGDNWTDKSRKRGKDLVYQKCVPGTGNGCCRVTKDDLGSTCSNPNKEISGAGDWGRGVVIRDGIRDAEEQGGFPATAEPSVHR